MRAAAILLMAGLQVGAPWSAVPASAWTAASFRNEFERPTEGDSTTAAAEAPRTPFTVVPLPPPDARGHCAAWTCAGAGLVLVGASFVLHEAADRRYDAYLRETDPARIDDQWRSTVRTDRLSTTSLITGEVLLAAAVYLRFLRRPPARVAVVADPHACAVTVRW